MAKHYKQDKKDRRDESRGMKKRLSDTQLYHKGKDYYGPGYGEPSNMPKDVMMTKYPMDYHNVEGPYSDTVREIDEDLQDSYRKVEAQRSDSMY